MSDMHESGYSSRQVPAPPAAFVWRRLHSLTGLFLVIFLIFHLFTNSQAAFYVGDDGKGFIHAVNSIHDFPYLFTLEVFLLGTPFLIHIIWGIRYIWTAKYNSFETDGSSPSLPEYSRNRAYTWQRWTSWILLIGVIAHVYHMRVAQYPLNSSIDNVHLYMVPISADEGLYTLAQRINAQIYDRGQIQQLSDQIHSGDRSFLPFITQDNPPHPLLLPTVPEAAEIAQKLREQQRRQDNQLVHTLQAHHLQEGEVLAVADNFATADLLMLRNTFKDPLMIALYSLFVIAAVYHAFNGLWTFMISWGVTLTQRSQDWMLKLSMGLMVLLAVLGLAAVWGTYWINLYA